MAESHRFALLGANAAVKEDVSYAIGDARSRLVRLLFGRDFFDRRGR
ncbi:MAG TPA: hypothetical protein VGY55_09040 [Pirellulales bacterium]|jgi:hypothetical protein|nr:hypothetical protein [Pirellulales bacterium]